MSNKQKLGYMAIGAGGPVVEASYEIAEEGYEATTGYRLSEGFGEPAVMQIWTIQFDKPPQALRVKNAVEYTLLDAELHIVAHCSELIIVLWDGGKKIFACPFHWGGAGRDRVTISYSYSPELPAGESIIINFNKNENFLNVGFMDVSIHGVRATEIKEYQYEAAVKLPVDLHSVTVTWTLTNGIRGSLTLNETALEAW